MSYKLNSNSLRPLLIVFIGISSLLLRPESMYSQTIGCIEIDSFRYTNLTTNSITYEWTGNTSGLSMNLAVKVNGTQVFSGAVTGNSHVVTFSTPLVNGDTVEGELEYYNSMGIMCSLDHGVIIVATTQPILDLGEACPITCFGVNFCENGKITEKIAAIEEYIFDPNDICNCSKIRGSEQIRCVEALMNGSNSREAIDCQASLGSSCSNENPEELIVSVGNSNSYRLQSNSEPIFNVYPNPFKSNVTIDLHNQPLVKGDIEIRDIYGKFVYRQPVAQNVVEINLELLPNGVYWISLSTNSSNVYKLTKVK